MSYDYLLIVPRQQIQCSKGTISKCFCSLHKSSIIWYLRPIIWENLEINYHNAANNVTEMFMFYEYGRTLQTDRDTDCNEILATGWLAGCSISTPQHKETVDILHHTVLCNVPLLFQRRDSANGLKRQPRARLFHSILLYDIVFVDKTGQVSFLFIWCEYQIR